MIGALSLLVLLAAPPAPLGLDEALARADRGAAVLLARAEAALALREAEAVRSPASPVLTLGTTRYAVREVISFSQEIRWGGEKRYAVRAARERAEAVSANAEEASREARRLVRQAWVAFAATEDSEELGKEGARRVLEVAGIVEARFDGGRVPRLELVRAKAEAARLVAGAEALGETRRAAWAHLATLLGLDPASEGTTDRKRPAPMESDALARTVAAARLAEHPAIVAGERNLASARASHEAARRRMLPGLSVAFGVGAGDPGNPGPEREATLSLTLPIGARGITAVRVAEAQVRVQEAGLEGARRELAESLAVSERRVRGLRAELVALEREALPAAEEAALLTREAYVAGRGDVLRLIDSERSLLEIRKARLDAWAAEKLAEADLLAAAGEVIE